MTDPDAPPADAQPKPKRRRSCLFGCLGMVLLFVVGPIVVYLGLSIYVRIGSPTLATDYLALLNADAEAALKNPDDCAWPIYRAAMIEHDFVNLDFESPESKKRQRSWNASVDKAEEAREDQAHLEKIIAAHPGLLEAIREGAAKPALGLRVGFDHHFTGDDRLALFGDTPTPPPPNATPTAADDGLLLEVPYPHLDHLRGMGRLLAADMRMAAQSGDADRVIADLDAMLGVAGHAEELPTVISALVGISVRGQSQRAFGTILVEHPALFTDKALQELSTRLAGAQADLRRACRGERYLFHDLVQRAYSDDGNGDGAITDEGIRFLFNESVSGAEPDVSLAATLGMPFAPLVFPSRRELLDAYDGPMAIDEAAFDVPIRDLPDTGSFDEMEHWSSWKWRCYYPLGLMLPNLSAARRIQEQQRALRDGLLVGIALERYRLAHGDWPDSLQALMPTYLPELPVDPITGGALGYRVVDGRPVVYSVGGDLDDDGGTVPVVDGEADPYAAAQWPGEPTAWGSPPDGDWILYPYPGDE